MGRTKRYLIRGAGVLPGAVPTALQFAATALALFLAGCSTTKRLTEEQTLYTGVHKIEIASMTEEDVPKGIESVIREPLNVKPNNPLFSPYVRTPLPMGLWVWNSFYTERQTGLRSWIYRRLGKKPVLVEQVQPQPRVDLVRDILDNHGYFGSTGGYETIPQKNPKKARLNYHFEVPRPWLYDSVAYPEVVSYVTAEINGLQRTSNIQPGTQYNVDTLTNERIRITNYLRERSYYYFRPEYVEYIADTTVNHYSVELRMRMMSGVPSDGLRPYKIGDISMTLFSSTGQGETDTVDYNGMKIVYQKPLKIRPKVLARSLTIVPGDYTMVSEINNTLTNLNKLGIFRYVNMEVTPLDSIRGRDSLNMNITAAFDQPLQAEFEVDFSHKSSSFIGPGAIFSLKNKNAFKGGELFGIHLNASYEWQTGNTSSAANSTAINSYEFGLNTSLTLPAIVPAFVPVGGKRGGNTVFNLGGNIMNRPKYFTMFSANLSAAYDFQTSAQSRHSWTPFKLVYNDLLRTTTVFDSIINQRGNEALRQSFEPQFIPSMSYTYTLDRRYGSSGQHRVIWQTTAIEAGNIMAGAYRLLGRGDNKTMFGRQFSQFLKATTEIKHYQNIGYDGVLVSRLSLGFGYPYGNFSTMPYNEQFYVGGANSIRAFTIRSLGPGSFHTPNSYLDQIGEIRFEANLEYRLNIYAGLNGAVFLDAGNVWLRKEDPNRPGGKFEMKNFWNELATGTGVGLRYDLSFLVVRVDLGVGIHLPYDTARKGYYNIPKFRDGLGLHLAIGYPF